ncbi:uncharacterized protein C2orf42 isoform X2 [Phymastichus coffea]|uniref:uncharacterized protein C2orf42 isoform X2 n=1 Tax=Phymastichus coffea TaxID=108790 RepID=UPI00273A8327|nr:uncharacterized protein C2orf42 isoform X2 [Phymastichus coffea]
MSAITSEEKFRSILADLGKATLRGVRKCPKCGTYNGSREACRLITGSTAQVFSVRVRDKGPDHRGFVQLSLVNISANNDSNISVPQSTALCFVDNCEKSFNNRVLQCHEKDISESSMSACQHIQAALRCYAEAQPLTLRNSVLSSLIVNNETKQEIWLLATETPGPLVQRVSKNIMAVKCKASPKHPVGYLHFSFFTTKFKEKLEHKFFCSNSLFKFSTKLDDKTNACTVNRCIHFYACICAFASDPKLAVEFQYYMNLAQTNNFHRESLDFELNSNETDKFIEMDVSDLDNLSDDAHLLIFRDDSLTIQNLQSNRIDIDSINIDPLLLAGNIDIIKDQEQNLSDDINIISEVHNLEVKDQNAVFDGSTIKIIPDPLLINSSFGNNLHCPQFIQDTIKPLNGTVKILDHNIVLDTNSIKFLESNSVPVINNKSDTSCHTASTIRKSMKRKREGNKNPSVVLNPNAFEIRKVKTKSLQSTKTKYPTACENIDESNTNLSFIRWLSSITERINQTMHFQFDGKPEPLVFHVPHTFFECLRERISCGGKKKRLPNSTTAFVRKDCVPLGTFTKYTWHITNILHVKTIFETPLIPLEITRSFLQNADGTYEVYKREETDIDKFKKTSNNPLIKPMELKTYLKVGNMSPNQIHPTPFLIEWIPDILPISKIGELRIRFEFGHTKNEPLQKYQKTPTIKN